GGQFGALQVQVETGKLVRQDHALVADGVGREAHHVVVGDVAQLLLAAAASQEQRQVEAFLVLPGAGLDVDLFDERQCLPGQLPTDTRVCGRRSPAQDA